jgi:hypothetical protein
MARWTVKWISRHGKTYALDVSPDLNTLEEIRTSIPSEGSRISITQAGGATVDRHFYRVREVD